MVTWLPEWCKKYSENILKNIRSTLDTNLMHLVQFWKLFQSYVFECILSANSSSSFYFGKILFPFKVRQSSLLYFIPILLYGHLPSNSWCHFHWINLPQLYQLVVFPLSWQRFATFAASDRHTKGDTFTCSCWRKSWLNDDENRIEQIAYAILFLKAIHWPYLPCCNSSEPFHNKFSHHSLLPTCGFQPS